jgi:hypothetical protein
LQNLIGRMNYRCGLSKAEVLDLYEEEIEHILKAIRREMDLDDLRFQEMLLEHSNMVQDPKGRNRRKKLGDIKRRRAALQERMKHSWLGRKTSGRSSRRSARTPSSS